MEEKVQALSREQDQNRQKSELITKLAARNNQMLEALDSKVKIIFNAYNLSLKSPGSTNYGIST